jgi:lysophospholipase L1-like esterase
VYTDIRAQFPKTPVLFISLKPCPSRWTMKDRMIEANTLIRKFLKKKKHARFVSVWNAMLDADGNPIADIFIEDKLHMNDKGYAIWQQILESHLKK